MILETERLYLREMNAGDFDALCRILQDEETMYAYEGAFSDEEVREWLDRQLSRYQKWGFGLWAVVLKETGGMIGQCGLTMQPWKSGEVLEIGYLFERRYWHKGYATEAARACKQYAFETLKAEEVCSIIRDTNFPSQRVALRSGLVKTDSWTKHYRGVDMPHFRYVAFRGEQKEKAMNIEEQFNLIAQEYDQNRRRFIPCFEDYYIGTTKQILHFIDSPKRVLDLGAGTGLLSYYWYRECPSARYVLVDIAEEMLGVSEKRFGGIDNVTHEICDYTKSLPEGEFDAVISALSIHHLEDEEKERLFRRIFEKLPQSGVFVNYDQFNAGSAKMNAWFDSYWEKQLGESGLSDRDIELWKERRKLDRECSVETEIGMLRRSGFSEVSCLYQNGKFSVIIVLK